jgi:hypothetical protein
MFSSHLCQNVCSSFFPLGFHTKLSTHFICPSYGRPSLGTLGSVQETARMCALYKAYNGERAWKDIGDRLQAPYYRSRVDHCKKIKSRKIFFINTFVSPAIPSLQLRLTTSLFSNLDSKPKTNSQYLSIYQYRVQVLICSHILLFYCLAQIPLALCSAFNSDHYAH